MPAGTVGRRPPRMSESAGGPLTDHPNRQATQHLSGYAFGCAAAWALILLIARRRRTARPRRDTRTVLRRMVGRLDLGHDRPSALSAAQEARDRGLRQTCVRVGRPGRRRCHPSHSRPAGRTPAVVCATAVRAVGGRDCCADLGMVAVGWPRISMSMPSIFLGESVGVDVGGGLDRFGEVVPGASGRMPPITPTAPGGP
jgi:hypothetical protein